MAGLLEAITGSGRRGNSVKEVIIKALGLLALGSIIAAILLDSIEFNRSIELESSHRRKEENYGRQHEVLKTVGRMEEEWQD